MANRSKTKGKTGERKFVNLLNEVFQLNFERVPNSGAFTGGKNIGRYDDLTDAQKLIHDGDIIVPPELSNYSIECKNYQDFPFHQLFLGECKLLDTWIDQASHTRRKKWILFFNITRKGEFVCYPTIYEFLTKGNEFLYKNEFIIENAKSFLYNNKHKILEKNYNHG